MTDCSSNNSHALPEGWKRTTIGDITGNDSLFSDGDWVESKDQDPDGANRLIQLADIGDGVFIDKSSRFMNDEQFERLKCTELHMGDILIARMPEPLGRACLYPLNSGNAATVVDVAVIRTVNADHYWLMSSINSPDFRFKIDLNASGTTRTRIARGALSNLQLLLPPLPEQQKIASILSSVDDVITKTTAQIDKLKDLKTGMMQELLTKGIGHTEFKDSPVGRIPVGWDVDNVGHLFEIQLGKMLSQASKKGDSPFPYLGNKNVQWGKVDLTNMEMMDFSERERKKFTLAKGDLLMCEGGDVGRSAIWEGELSNCYYQKAIHRLRPLEGSYQPRLLMEYIRYAKLRNLLAEFISQTSIAHLTKEKLASIPVPVPPMEEQMKIVEICTGVDSKIQLISNKLEKISQTKKALMQDLLTGKVRVSVDS